MSHNIYTISYPVKSFNNLMHFILKILIYFIKSALQIALLSYKAFQWNQERVSLNGLYRVFGYMRTTKAQISLRIRVVWSGHSVSANRSIEYYRMYQWRANVRMRICACVEWIRICAFCSKTRFFFARPILYAFCFGLNIFYCKITMSIQTYMAYTQKIGLERKHKLIQFYYLLLCKGTLYRLQCSWVSTGSNVAS